MGAEKFKVSGYAPGKGELNLSREFKRIVQRAYDLYPKMGQEFIGERLGISPKTLGKVVKEWGINTHKGENVKRNRNPDAKASFKIKNSKYF